MFYIVYVPPGLLTDRGKIFTNIIFLNLILGWVCSIKFFKIPSFNTTFWLPTGIQTGPFLKDTLTKLKNKKLKLCKIKF